MKKGVESMLSPEFIERLWALRELAFRIYRKREMRGYSSGQAPEFESHRSYEPGDEPRYIDWNVYARLEKLLLKMYVIDEETQISILLDTSLSMRSPAPRKMEMALRLAAAFTYLALAAKHNPVLGTFSERVLATRGPFRSLTQLPECLSFLADPPTGRRTDLDLSLTEFMNVYRGRSLILLISDFFQEGNIMTALDRVLFQKADLHLIQVVDDAELSPKLRGEVSVSDVEADELVNLTAGYDLQAALRAMIRDFVRDIEEGCRRRSIPYLLARTSQNFEDLVIDHLLGRAGQQQFPGQA